MFRNYSRRPSLISVLALKVNILSLISISTKKKFLLFLNLQCAQFRKIPLKSEYGIRKFQVKYLSAKRLAQWHQSRRPCTMIKKIKKKIFKSKELKFHKIAVCSHNDSDIHAILPFQ